MPKQALWYVRYCPCYTLIRHESHTTHVNENAHVFIQPTVRTALSALPCDLANNRGTRSQRYLCTRPANYAHYLLSPIWINSWLSTSIVENTCDVSVLSFLNVFSVMRLWRKDPLHREENKFLSILDYLYRISYVLTNVYLFIV